VDAASHDVRAAGAKEFMFSDGPVRRFVSEPSWREPYSESIWPGGVSGVLGSPWYANFLPLWLTNEAIPLLLDQSDVQRQASEVTTFVPAR
jgi:penicillin amidase